MNCVLAKLHSPEPQEPEFHLHGVINRPLDGSLRGHRFATPARQRVWVYAGLDKP